MSAIKYRRACAATHRVGRYPRTAAAIWSTIPFALVATLSSRKLAKIMDACYSNYLVGRDAERHDMDALHDGSDCLLPKPTERGA